MARGRKTLTCKHGVFGVARCKKCARERQVKWREIHKHKALEQSRRWYKNNVERSRFLRRRSWRKQNGVNVGGEVKTGKCPLCLKRKTLVPDHDHSTGKLRGWICGVCNRALGMYEALKSNPRVEPYLKGKRK